MMSIELFPYSLAALVVLLYIAIAVVLARRYLSTRDVGLVWLGSAVIVWPIASFVLDAGRQVLMGRAMRREEVLFPFTLVERGQLSVGMLTMSLDLSRQIVGLALLFVAVIYIHRANGANRHPFSN
jgi:hypothetical protein